MTVNCINGNLEKGDLILCSPDVPIFRYMSGKVEAVYIQGTPEHSVVTCRDCDCIAISFDRDLSPQREREFYKNYSPYFESTPFSYDTVYIHVDDVICITGISEKEHRDILDSEEKARRVYRHYLCRYLDEKTLAQCGIDPDRYPAERPGSFNYAQAQKDILRLCHERSAIVAVTQKECMQTAIKLLHSMNFPEAAEALDSVVGSGARKASWYEKFKAAKGRNIHG